MRGWSSRRRTGRPPQKKENMAPKQKTTYTFLYSGGNMTLVLAGSRHETTRNALGDPMARKLIHAKKIVFQNGFGHTTDPDVVELLKDHHHWGREITWHPTSAPKEEQDEVKPLAEKIEASLKQRDKEKQKGFDAAREGSIPRE
jgi:hypothetical protein